MNRQIDDIMELCYKISSTEQIKTTVDNSYKGAAAAGGGAVLGGILGGPPGVFIGGALGGAMGWWMTRGEFRPLHEVIMEMTPEQKMTLYSEIKKELGNLQWVDTAELILKVFSKTSLRNKILNIIMEFARKQLSASA